MKQFQQHAARICQGTKVSKAPSDSDKVVFKALPAVPNGHLRIVEPREIM